MTFPSFLFMERNSLWRPWVEERTGRPLPIRVNSNHGQEGRPRSVCPPLERVGGPHVDKGADGYEGGGLLS